MHVAALYRHPVKSMGGQSVDRAIVDPIGIHGDRRWMVVNAAGRFLTRRELPHLARIEARPQDDGISLHHAEGGEIHVPFPPSDAATETVRIWKDDVQARIADPRANDYVSTLLGRPLRLAYQADDCPRPVDPGYAAAGDAVSFADGFPLLVTTTPSLDALNARLAVPVAMERFRPNIVIAGDFEPWAEDRWHRIRIGDVELRIAKPCARCVMVTQDPVTGDKVDGDEPLPTLRAMGRQAVSGIIFGQNAIPDRFGAIAVGDAVELIEDGESNLVFRRDRPD